MKSKSFFSIRFCLSVILLSALVLTPRVQLNARLEARAKTTTGVKSYSSKPTKEALKWANKQLRRMSLDEKIGQLICVGINATFLNQDSDAFIEGVQSERVIATAKHLPGHGDTATDSHRGLPEINVSRERLNAVELVPFRAAVNSGVGSVMTGHIGIPQVDPTAVIPLPRDIKLKPIDTDESG